MSRCRACSLAVVFALGGCGGAESMNEDAYWFERDTAPIEESAGAYDMQMAYGQSGSYAAQVADFDDIAIASTESTRSRSGRSERLAQSGPAPAPMASDANRTAANPAAEPAELEEPEPSNGPLLVYTAQVVLAIYDVARTQDEALALVESHGGYASERSQYAMTFRVPAAHFREVLDGLDALGDTLSLDWQAADVSEQYRDLDVRLRNALSMQARLQALLDQAESIEDALAIERELERVTLQIEQMRGQLRVLTDRIAFSTITLRFQQVATSDVPTDEYRLPFGWLNGMGVERLLSL